MNNLGLFDENAAVNELRADAARLLAQVEGEKNRVARAIHDELGQKLTVLSLQLSLWKMELDNGQSRSVTAIREKIAGLSDLLNSMIGFTHTVSGSLRPRVLEEFGLCASLEWLSEKLQKEYGVRCTFKADRPKVLVDPFLAIQIFRLAEELASLRIAAGARSLNVQLFAHEEAIGLIFEDGGLSKKLTPEILSRVRLLSGEIENRPSEHTILVTIPLKLGTDLLH